MIWFIVHIPSQFNTHFKSIDWYININKQCKLIPQSSNHQQLSPACAMYIFSSCLECCLAWTWSRDACLAPCWWEIMNESYKLLLFHYIIQDLLDILQLHIVKSSPHLWLFLPAECLNLCRHLGHEYGISPVCTRMWLVSCCFCRKLEPHSRHWK